MRRSRGAGRREGDGEHGGKGCFVLPCTLEADRCRTMLAYSARRSAAYASVCPMHASRPPVSVSAGAGAADALP